MPPPRPAPSVTIVIVNLDGEDHLPTCLDSVAALDYDAPLHTILVDNGSGDGSLALLAERYPWVRVLPQDRNLGFAPAVNIGVRAADTDCVALLNNDMRVEPTWVSELVAAYDPAGGVVCVGGQIMSWDGETVDFCESSMNMFGMGEQVGYGRPAAHGATEDRDDMLFACGGAMLVHRETYLDVGGLDDDYFAYFEDVDFGWRLWVLGYRVRLAARARSYHRMHGTSARFPTFQRLLLLERNALRTLIKNYDDEHLREILAPALFLAVKRGMIITGSDRRAFHIGGDLQGTETVVRDGLSTLHAVVDVADGIDQLLAKRAEVQRRRQRRDDEIVDLFGHPMRSVWADRAYLEDQHKLVAGFGVDEAFERQRAATLLVVATNVGDLERAVARAVELDGLASVVLAVPKSIDATTMVARSAPVDVQRWERPEELLVLASRSDVALVPPSLPQADDVLTTWPVVVVDVDASSGPGDLDPVLARRADAFLVGPEGENAWRKALTDAGRRAADDALLVQSPGGGVLEALRPLVAGPWQWRQRRRAAAWNAAVTDDVKMLIDQQRDVIRAYQEALRVNEQHVEEMDRLRATIAHQQRRLDQVRRVLAPAIRARALLRRTNGRS